MDKKFVIVIEVIQEYSQRFNPPRRFQIRNEIVDRKKVMLEKQYESTEQNLKKAGYIFIGEKGQISLTEKGEEALKRYYELKCLSLWEQWFRKIKEYKTIWFICISISGVLVSVLKHITYFQKFF